MTSRMPAADRMATATPCQLEGNPSQLWGQKSKPDTLFVSMRPQYSCLSQRLAACATGLPGQQQLAPAGHGAACSSSSHSRFHFSAAWPNPSIFAFSTIVFRDCPAAGLRSPASKLLQFRCAISPCHLCWGCHCNVSVPVPQRSLATGYATFPCLCLSCACATIFFGMKPCKTKILETWLVLRGLRCGFHVQELLHDKIPQGTQPLAHHLFQKLHDPRAQGCVRHCPFRACHVQQLGKDLLGQASQTLGLGAWWRRRLHIQVCQRRCLGHSSRHRGGRTVCCIGCCSCAFRRAHDESSAGCCRRCGQCGEL